SLTERERRKGAKTLDQPLVIHRANLVEDDVARLALKLARYTERIRVPARRERRHDEGSEVSVQLVGRDDDAGPLLADLAPSGWIEVDQEHVATGNLPYRPRHSLSSKRVRVGASSRRSSPRPRMSRAASAQPARGAAREVMTTALPRTCTSTSPSSPASSISGLGSRTPRELPIRMSRDFTMSSYVLDL